MLGPTAWRRITQEDIDAFARLSGDRQWIHTDVERARRESPFGTTIAHGTLTLALIDGFRDELVGAAPPGTKLGVNLGYDRVRFPAPVPAGSRIRGRFRVEAVEEVPGGVQATIAASVEREGEEKPACVAELVFRLLR